MLLKEFLSVGAGLIMLYSYVPYARDILKCKVKPARSARLMFVLLLVLSLLQQRALGSGWLLAMTIGDVIGAVAILMLSLKRGVGGLKTLDVICYALLIVDVMVWLSTHNALLALYLSILADLIGMTPVYIKTWYQPWSETSLFFVLGVVAPILNIIGANHYSYAIIVFPLYIALANLVEVLIIWYRQNVIPKPNKKLIIN